jgi:hypothetical protein
MVVHEHPGVDGTLTFRYCLSQAIKKTNFILVVSEDGRFIDAPHHDVMESTGGIEASFSWHGAILSRATIHVKHNAP